MTEQQPKDPNHLDPTILDPEDYWIFGYGSLIFKEPPHVIERITGYVEKSVRRFWQQSTDHRGTHEHPGRAVTLLTHEAFFNLNCKLEFKSDTQVYGVAFKIDPKYAQEVKEYMDFREKHGYEEVYLPFISTDKNNLMNFPCRAYVGLPTNFAFAGPAPMEDVAEIVRVSEGPSGKNIDYLIKLDKAIQRIHPEHQRDDYLAKLLELCGQQSN